MQNNREKVISYAKLLASNLQKDGNPDFSNKILNLLSGKGGAVVNMDQIFTPPVDQDSRMRMADIIYPGTYSENLVLPDSVSSKISYFIESYRHKDAIIKAGVDTNFSLLLYGEPGCGKTTIAKYIANELNLPLVVARFDALVSSLLGNTSKNIRKIFEYTSSSQCILFLDELDAIAKARDDQHELGELKRVINSLLQNIDSHSQSILIGATNHPDLLDKAIWRRFSNIIKVDRLDSKHMKSLLEIYLKDYFNDDLSEKKWTTLINALDGLSPSDVKNISYSAVTDSVIKNNNQIEYSDILYHTFLFKNNNNYSMNNLVKFLKEHSVSIRDIAEVANTSIRQIENILNPDNNEKKLTN